MHTVGPGGGCLVSADFSPVGSSQTRVEVYLGGQLVGSVTSSNGFLGTLPSHGNLIDCGMLLRPLPGFKVIFDSNFMFVPATGTNQFTGNELHILAAGPSGPVESLSRFSVQSCGIRQF